MSRSKATIITALEILNEAKPMARKRAEKTLEEWGQFIDLHVTMLSDVDPTILQTAIVKIVNEHKYPDWPTIAEIRDAVNFIIERSMDLPTTGEAWEIVLAEVRRIGIYGKPEFKNEMIAAAVRSMGWRQLCLSEAPAGVDRAQFRDIFNALHKRAIEDHRTHPLVAAQIESLREERLGLNAGEKMKELAEKLSGKKES